MKAVFIFEFLDSGQWQLIVNGEVLAKRSKESEILALLRAESKKYCDICGGKNYPKLVLVYPKNSNKGVLRPICQNCL